MSNEKFTLVSEVLKKETETSRSSNLDWAEDDNEDQIAFDENIWENVTTGETLSISDIQQQQKEDTNEKSWPVNEQEKKRELDIKRSNPPRNFNRRERPPPNREVPDDPPYTARISNLNYKVSEDDLKEFFGELGIKEVKVLTDRDTNRPRGVAIIEFDSKDGLESAIKADGHEFMERNMEVSVNIRKDNYNRSSFNKKRDYEFRKPYRNEQQNDQDVTPRERKKTKYSTSY